MLSWTPFVHLEVQHAFCCPPQRLLMDRPFLSQYQGSELEHNGLCSLRDRWLPLPPAGSSGAVCSCKVLLSSSLLSCIFLIVWVLYIFGYTAKKEVVQSCPVRRGNEVALNIMVMALVCIWSTTTMLWFHTQKGCKLTFFFFFRQMKSKQLK